MTERSGLVAAAAQTEAHAWRESGGVSPAARPRAARRLAKPSRKAPAPSASPSLRVRAAAGPVAPPGAVGRPLCLSPRWEAPCPVHMPASGAAQFSSRALLLSWRAGRSPACLATALLPLSPALPQSPSVRWRMPCDSHATSASRWCTPTWRAGGGGALAPKAALRATTAS